MSKLDKLIDTYVGKGATEKEVKSFYQDDNTVTKKYAEKMIQLYIKRKSAANNRNKKDIVNLLLNFEKLLPYIEKKDIYDEKTYHSLGVIINVVDKANQIKEEKTFIREDHVDVLMDNDSYLLVHPFTHKGSLKYGANTKWCTASKENEYTFTSYGITNGILFYLIRKNLKGTRWDKVAFHMTLSQNPISGAIQVYCSKDNNSTVDDMINSDWSLDEWISIQMLCRAFAVEEMVKQKRVKSILKFVNTINKLNIDEVVDTIDKLQKGTSGQSQKMIKEFTDVVSSFTNKIKTINKNGKFTTEDAD